MIASSMCRRSADARAVLRRSGGGQTQENDAGIDEDRAHVPQQSCLTNRRKTVTALTSRRPVIFQPAGVENPRQRIFEAGRRRRS